MAAAAGLAGVCLALLSGALASASAAPLVAAALAAGVLFWFNRDTPLVNAIALPQS